MGRMTKQNLNNIMDRFERETGTELKPRERSFHGKRLILLAAALALCAMIAAFTHPLFTPLDGDELTLEGTYLGNGIVSVWVENRSDKVLTFTDAKLFSWNDGEVEPIPGSRVGLTNTRVEPHEEGILTVDLSGAYDISVLETTTPGKPKQSWYYLLLTNQSFLFGHDWMCSFHFVEEEPAEEESPPLRQPQSVRLEGIPEELRFYFEQPYYDEIPAFNEQNFSYQQKVQELLMRTPGTLVYPVDPLLILREDALSDRVIHRYSSLDGFKRMVGSRFSGEASDKVFQICGILTESTVAGTGENTVPLVFLAVFETEAASAEGACAFLYGRMLPFAELETDRVYEGEEYTVYDVTDLYYTDLCGYLYDLTGDNGEELLASMKDIRDYYRDPDNLTFSFPAGQE